MCVCLCSCYCTNILNANLYSRRQATPFPNNSDSSPQPASASGSQIQSHILRHSVSSCVTGSVHQTTHLTLGNRMSVTLDALFNAIFSHEKIREFSTVFSFFFLHWPISMFGQHGTFWKCPNCTRRREMKPHHFYICLQEQQRKPKCFSRSWIWVTTW